MPNYSRAVTSVLALGVYRPKGRDSRARVQTQNGRRPSRERAILPSFAALLAGLFSRPSKSPTFSQGGERIIESASRVICFFPEARSRRNTITSPGLGRISAAVNYCVRMYTSHELSRKGRRARVLPFITNLRK